jgi:GNAT superfamily N-acetyltransferase
MEATVAVIVRVTPGVHWHLLADDVVAGRGHALHRPDARVFISVDSWADDVFETLARAMIGDLARPLYTVVADDDREHLGRWARLGFVDNRRENEYAVPTAPATTGLGAAAPPPGVALVGADRVDPARLHRLDERLRQDVPGYAGWSSSADEFRRATLESPWFDPATSLVAVAQDGEHLGLVRILGARRHPRLGLVGVLPGHRRRGIARALLAGAFGALDARGVGEVTAEADERDPAAGTLLRGIGARRTGGAVELVHRGTDF